MTTKSSKPKDRFYGVDFIYYTNQGRTISAKRYKVKATSKKEALKKTREKYGRLWGVTIQPW